MPRLLVTDHPTGARLEIRVKPRASRTAIVGILEGNLVVALSAPPVDGQANEELTRSLAKWLKVAPRTVTVHSGDRSRTKLLNFSGLSAEELSARLLPLCPTSAEP